MSKYNPVKTQKPSDHRPLRWIVRQIAWNPETRQDEEVVTGYHNKLEQIPGMSSILHQALFNIQKYGGELWADYGDDKPVLVRNYT
jgi:hypothetical protein